jgi:hypothetical protein
VVEAEEENVNERDRLRGFVEDCIGLGKNTHIASSF